MAALKTVYEQLTRTPAAFFKQHLVIPAGRSPQYGSTMAADYQLFHKSDMDSHVYQVAPGHTRPESQRFTAAYLIMTEMTENMPTGDFDVPGTFTVTVPSHGQLLLVTGQLSGCTVCWRKDGSHRLIVAHIRPVGRLSGAQLHQAVKDHGLIEGKHVQGSFGPLDYQTGGVGYAHVFGVWSPEHKAWGLYAQKPGDRGSVAKYWNLLDV